MKKNIYILILCFLSFFGTASSQNCSVLILESEICINDTVHLIFTGVPPFDLDYTFNGTRQIITVSGMDTALVATQAGENLFIMYGLISGNGCYLGDVGEEQGVNINGVIWATRNVGMPKTFAATPEDAGMFYQWGKNVGWSTSDPMINSNGGTVWDWTSVPNYENWKPENDPCPCGWRVPTKNEQWDMIEIGSADVIQNGVLGRLSRTDRNSIFLPYAKLADGRIAGWRNSDGSLNVFEFGDYLNGLHHSDYWAATGNQAWDLCFRLAYPVQEQQPKAFCTLVRCVKDSSRDCFQTDTVFVTPILFDTVATAICIGDSLFFNGNYYSQTGLYNDTLQSFYGCDSIVTLKLTKLNNTSYTYRDTSYKCEWYYFGNDSINETGIYIDTLVSQNGCDSIVTLDLLVRPSEFDDTLNICINKLPHTIYDTIFNQNTINGTYIIHHRCATITLLVDIMPKIETLPTDIPLICADDDNFILNFPNTNAPNTKSPTHYEIIFDNEAITAGFENQNGEIGSDNEIIVQMPEKIYPDYYNCKIILSDNVYNCTSQEFDIEFPVLYPDTIMEQKWDDVIALLNYYYNGNFEFSAYQWYRNGAIMPNETKSYIYLAGSSLIVGDKYSVLITRPDGSQMFSCEFTAREAHTECCEYPQIVQNGSSVKIYVKGKAKANLWSLTGVLLQTMQINSPMHEISVATKGMYLLEILPENKTEGRVVVPIIINN